MPTAGKAAARTALPQPPSTSQNVPINSAESLENTTHSFNCREMEPLTGRAAKRHASAQAYLLGKTPARTHQRRTEAIAPIASVRNQASLAALERYQHRLCPDDVHLVADLHLRKSLHVLNLGRVLQAARPGE